jgi:PAS domain S-box-containing protein
MQSQTQRAAHDATGDGRTPRARPRMGIGGKFALLVALLVAGTAITQGVVLYQVAARGFVDLERDRLSYRVQNAAQGFARRLEALPRDVLTLAQTPPIRGVINTLEHGGEFEGSSYSDWRERLSVIFSGFARFNPAYLQVRYIGVADGGRELVRVDRIGDRVVVVDSARLQRKAQRPYFQRTVSLTDGAVYISEIELNRDFGALTLPYQPTVRAATPVYAPDGKLFGIVIINVDARRWLDELAASAVATDTVYLTNERGDYLLHPDPARTFGFDLGVRHRLPDDLPLLGDIFSDKSIDVTEVSTGDSVIYAQKISYDPQNPGRFLVLSVASPKSLLLASTHQMGKLSALLVLAMIAVGIAGSRLLSRPLVELLDSARRVARGDLDSGLRLKGSASADEVGILADAFRTMSGALRERELSLAASLATTKAILESVAVTILTTDVDGRIETVNRSTESTFGFSASELVGAHITKLLPAVEMGTGDQSIDAYRAGREEVAVRKDGQAVPVLLTMAEVGLSTRNIYTVVVSDLTQVKQADKVKNEFISIVSHELRTPLTSMRGTLGLLLGEVAGALPEKAREFATIAYRNSERLGYIVNDILDVEKLAFGKLRFFLQPTNVGKLLAQTIETNAHFGARTGVTFVLEDDGDRPRVMADPHRLMQVVTNLLSNAAKHSPPDSEVTIGTRSFAHILRIWVRDRGPGIPEELGERVFEKFVQGDDPNVRRHDGTGLGLSIARDLVHGMHGRIGFETEAGKGTTFFIDLPLAADEAGPAFSPSLHTENQAGAAGTNDTKRARD